MHKTIRFKIILVVLFALISRAGLYAADVTVEGLQARGIHPLENDSIRQLIIDKVIIVRNLDTLSHYQVKFNKDGTRTLQGVAATKMGGGIEYIPFTADPKKHTAKYEIRDGKLITRFDGKRFEVTIFKLEQTYYAAHSNDKGAIKWELVAQ